MQIESYIVHLHHSNKSSPILSVIHKKGVLQNEATRPFIFFLCVKYPQPVGWHPKHILHSDGADRSTYQTCPPKHRHRAS